MKYICFICQHKDFEEIEGRLQRREPLILGNTVSHKQNRRFPGEVISDPLSDTEEEGRTDPQKPHQVYYAFLPSHKFEAKINILSPTFCSQSARSVLLSISFYLSSFPLNWS